MSTLKLTQERGNRLSIAVVTDRFPVLSETFVVNEIQELRRQGLDVTVEASGRPPDAAGDTPLSAHYLDEGMTTKLLALARLAVRHPLRVLQDLAGRRRWRREGESARPLRALAPRAARLRSNASQHLHVHFAAEAALDTMRLARILDLPWSVTAHAYEIFAEPHNLDEKLTAAAFATTGCEYNARYLRKMAPGAASEIHVQVMGIDPDSFERTSPYPATPSVVAVGRLVEKKGFDVLIAAAAMSTAIGKVVIVGDGPLRGDLELQIEDLGLADRVEMAGSRSPEAVRDVLESAAVLAMPARIAADGDRDSMPLVVKEAMAMEIPVVASDEVGLPELIDDEVGRLVPANDATALAAGIEQVLELPEESRRALGQAGRARVLEHANLGRETAMLVALMERRA